MEIDAFIKSEGLTVNSTAEEIRQRRIDIVGRAGGCV
jgi:hypothetical protein